MARKPVRVSANADAHERAENRLLRKMASLHKEKVTMAAEPRKHAGPKHLEHAAERKHGGKKEGHVHQHHHHHHHHGAMKKAAAHKAK